MTIDEARDECMRWLAYLARQEEKSKSLQKLAAECRAGMHSGQEAQRRLAAIQGCGVIVYDGANLAEAVRVLLGDQPKT